MKLPASIHTGFPLWLKAIFLVLALVNLLRLNSTPPSAEEAVDFRNVYLGQQLLIEGVNPYNNDSIQSDWKVIKEAEGIETESQPGFPTNPLLYPPWALSFFAFLAPFGFKIASVIWYVLIPVFVVGTAYFVAFGWDKNNGWGVFWDVLLVALAFKGTIHAFIVGQPSFLCYLFLMASLYYYRKDKALPSGILLGLAGFKISLVAPFGLLMLLNRQWRIAGWAILTGAILWMVAIVLNGDPLLMHQSMLENMSAFRSSVFDPSQPNYPLYFVMTQLTELGVIVEYFQQGASQQLSLIYLIIGLPALAGLLFLKFRQNLSDLEFLLGLCLLLLLTTYHHFYDLLLLLLLVPYSRVLPGKEGFYFLLVSLPFFLPVNGLLTKLGLPAAFDFFYFNTPIAVSLIAILLCRQFLLRRKNA